MISRFDNFDPLKFEIASEQVFCKLLGGFSTSFGYTNDIEIDVDERNNCMGSNCRTDCGEGQNRDCNTIVHCGA